MTHVHVDPAHPAFPTLPREQRAQIPHSMRWNQTAIAEELGAHQTTVRYWVDPEWRDRKRADALRRFHSRKHKDGSQ